jgi:hypothetical protein
VPVQVEEAILAVINNACSAAMKYRSAGRTPPCPSTRKESAPNALRVEEWKERSCETV